MLAIPIEFRFDIESEVNRVKETLDNLEWLTKNNYQFLLPNNVKTKNANIETIRKSVADEYDLNIYQIAKSAILKSWEGNSGLVRRINQKMSGSHMLDKLIIVLTRYGTQGSYLTPNSAIINISKIPPEFLIKTIIHESLHLMIEHLIKKYSVNHWVKERIVDLIMDIEYKSRFKMQLLPDWVISADTIFKEHYPNLTLIVEESAKISPDKRLTLN